MKDTCLCVQVWSFQKTVQLKWIRSVHHTARSVSSVSLNTLSSLVPWSSVRREYFLATTKIKEFIKRYAGLELFKTITMPGISLKVPTCLSPPFTNMVFFSMVSSIYFWRAGPASIPSFSYYGVQLQASWCYVQHNFIKRYCGHGWNPSP